MVADAPGLTISYQAGKRVSKESTCGADAGSSPALGVMIQTCVTPQGQNLEVTACWEAAGSGPLPRLRQNTSEPLPVLEPVCCPKGQTCVTPSAAGLKPAAASTLDHGRGPCCGRMQSRQVHGPRAGSWQTFEDESRGATPRLGRGDDRSDACILDYPHRLAGC